MSLSFGTREQNQRFTRVGPDTPVGELVRRYWHPMAAAAQMGEQPVRKVRLLGEDLVLYREGSGNLGLIDEPCPHRRVSKEYGISEQEGLRCSYQSCSSATKAGAWSNPAERWDSTLKDRIITKAYTRSAHQYLRGRSGTRCPPPP